MLDRQPDVLIQMETRYLGPIDSRLIHQCGEKLELTRTGCHNDPRFTANRNRLADHVGGRVSGKPRHIPLVLPDHHFHTSLPLQDG